MNILCYESKKKINFFLIFYKWKKNCILFILKIFSCFLVIFLLYELKIILILGNEIKCWIEMKKGSIDEIEVIVKLVMMGRYVLEIRILDWVVVSKEFESKLGKCFLNVLYI